MLTLEKGQDMNLIGLDHSEYLDVDKRVIRTLK
jgi:hypothetical protein